jgi:hypothetical protein
MRRRGIDPRWPPSQDVVSWTAWHRLHAWDPRWEQHVITGNGPAEHAYTRWTHWDQTDPRWQVTVSTPPMRTLTRCWNWLQPGFQPNARKSNT